MKITNVRACQPVTPNSPADWRTSVGQILVAVDTDCGLTGYGVGGGGFAGIHIVQTVLRECLIGHDGGNIEVLWRKMYDTTMAFGQKGLVIMAISGVDLALWDLKGKAEGVSIAELLGGMRHTDLPTYVTTWDNATLREVVDNSEPHQGFKLHLGDQDPAVEDIDDFADRIAGELADARSIVGSEVELMADAWMRWTLPATQAVLDRLDSSVNLSWLEEPLPLDDEAGYAKLVEESQTPIAGGEHEFTTSGFRHLIDNRLHNVLQPDVNWCGGLSVLKDIYEIANQENIRVCPHRGAEIWSLHAIATLDKQPLAESGRPWMTWVKDQPPIENGRVKVPDLPGFGLQIDEDSLDVYPPPTF